VEGERESMLRGRERANDANMISLGASDPSQKKHAEALSLMGMTVE